ncbi:MAG: uncharacterized membrane protein YqaE (UPF0057 family), partial [Bacteroidia bacterium]
LKVLFHYELNGKLLISLLLNFLGFISGIIYGIIVPKK